MDLGIASRVALVQGAGGGLGRAIALALAAEGVSVAVADQNRERVEETAAEVRSSGNKVAALTWNLSDLSSINANFERIERELGPVEILVNNTGGPPPTPANGQDPQVWSDHFKSMVLSVIAITDRALPAMRAGKWGRVVTSTSSGVIAPLANLGISNTLRMSLVGWSKTLAGEVGPDGVTANVVVPGHIATRRTLFLDRSEGDRRGLSPEDVEAERAATIPVGRYGDPREYGDVVAFLASERAGYITGSIIRVDGGVIRSL